MTRPTQSPSEEFLRAAGRVPARPSLGERLFLVAIAIGSGAALAMFLGSLDGDDEPTRRAMTSPRIVADYSDPDCISAGRIDHINKTTAIIHRRRQCLGETPRPYEVRP